jgi:hypothetical protein
MGQRLLGARRRFRYWPALLVFVGVVLSGTAVAQGDRLGGKFRSGSTVTVGDAETLADDLYAAGRRIDIAGRVDGDVTAAGGEVEISGTVTGDVLAIGGQVTVIGDVQGDVRAAGGSVMLEGPVGEDVAVAGGRLTIARGARIGGDLLFSSGQMSLDGSVQGDVLGSTGTYDRSGSIAGTERVSTRPREQAPPSAGDRILGTLRRYVAVVVIGVLFLWLVPRFTERAAAQARLRPLPSLGVGALGVLGFVLVLIALILAMVLASLVLGLLGLSGLVVILGMALALVAGAVIFAFVLTVAFLADALVGLALGRLMLRADEPSSKRSQFVPLALGAAVVVIVVAIPVIGGIVKFVVVLAGLGALLLAARRSRRPAPAG